MQEETQWQQAISTIINQFGVLNILVNNAGITGFQEDFGPQDPENSSLESWREVFAINIESVFLGCKTPFEQ